MHVRSSRRILQLSRDVATALNYRIRVELVTENDTSENPACRTLRVFRYSDSRLIHLSETGEVVPVLALFVASGRTHKAPIWARKMPWNARQAILFSGGRWCRWHAYRVNLFCRSVFKTDTEEFVVSEESSALSDFYFNSGRRMSPFPDTTAVDLAHGPTITGRIIELRKWRWPHLNQPAV
jgi:hypothetical protein